MTEQRLEVPGKIQAEVLSAFNHRVDADWGLTARIDVNARCGGVYSFFCCLSLKFRSDIKQDLRALKQIEITVLWAA